MKTITQVIIAIALMLTLQVSAQGVGSLAPDFTLTNVDGSSFKLSDNRGKVVFVFLFGSSCPHCIANGYNTESGIYAKHKSNGNFVAVGVDTWDGAKAVVENYKSTTGVTYPLLLNGSGLLASYSITYDRIIVIDQEGFIRYKATSDASSAVVSQANGIIEDLLATAPVSTVSEEDVSKLEAKYSTAQGVLELNNPYGVENSATYRVLDMSGHVLQQNTIHLSKSNTIVLGASSPGVNIISISDGQKTYTAKFVR